jgi:hypothetical protein
VFEVGFVDVASVVEVMEALAEVVAVVDAVPGRHWSRFFSLLSSRPKKCDKLTVPLTLFRAISPTNTSSCASPS